MLNSVVIMDAEAISRALRRIAHEILEHNPRPEKFALVGIPSRGMEITRRLCELIEQIEGQRPETGTVDISMHRDDLRLRGGLKGIRLTQLPLRLEDLTIILADDVLFTGRTCRAAMDAISSFGRPSRIQFAVLVDRGHRELPIRPDYVGKNLPTARSEVVKVRLQGMDEEPDSVSLEKQ